MLLENVGVCGETSSPSYKNLITEGRSHELILLKNVSNYCVNCRTMEDGDNYHKIVCKGGITCGSKCGEFIREYILHDP